MKLPENPYCNVCLTKKCKCKMKFSDRMEEVINTMKVCDIRMGQLERANTELLEMLIELIDVCPADPDATKPFFAANKKAAALISEYK